MEHLSRQPKGHHAHHNLDHIKICWTLGHMGIPDNEITDEEAKKVAAGDSSPPHQLPKQLRPKKHQGQGQALPHSKSTAKQELYMDVKELRKDIFIQSKRAGLALSINLSLPSSTFLKLTKKFQQRYMAIIFQLCTDRCWKNLRAMPITYDTF